MVNMLTVLNWKYFSKIKAEKEKTMIQTDILRYFQLTYGFAIYLFVKIISDYC